jgi:hypothetical protein
MRRTILLAVASLAVPLVACPEKAETPQQQHQAGACHVAPPSGAESMAARQQAEKLNANVLWVAPVGAGAGVEHEQQAVSQVKETYQTIDDKQVACAMLFQTIACIETRSPGSPLAMNLAGNISQLCGSPQGGTMAGAPSATATATATTMGPAYPSTPPTATASGPGVVQAAGPPPPASTAPPPATTPVGSAATAKPAASAKPTTSGPVASAPTNCSVSCGGGKKTSCQITCAPGQRALCVCDACVGPGSKPGCERERCRCE